MSDLGIWEWAFKVGGPLFVVLIAFSGAVWYCLRWLANNVAVPVRDRFLQHIDHTDAAILRFADNDTKQTIIMEKLAVDISQMKAAMTDVRCPVIQKINESMDHANHNATPIIPLLTLPAK